VADTAVCHVVDPTGKPIANAVVYSVLNPWLSNDVTTLATDKSGGFTVNNVGDGAYRLYVIDAPGFAPTGGMLAAGDNIFQLNLPTKLTGKVIDSKGQPVVGATVSAEDAKTSEGDPIGFFASGRLALFMIAPLVNRYTVKTDAAGTYTLDDIPADSKVDVQLNDPRFVTAQVVSDKGAPTAPPLTAEPGTTISGKVTREDGRPIDPALLVAAELTGQYGSAHFAKVAADGTYKIESLGPGSYKVFPPDFPGSTAFVDFVDPLPVKVTATIDTPGTAPDLLLTSGGIVTGSVLDAKTKKPVPNVEISFQEAFNAGDTRVGYSKTDADGKFTGHVWAGKVDVNTLTDLDDYISNTALKPVTITTVAGQTVTLDPILLNRVPPVTGTAVDESGKPLPNVVLQAQEVNNDAVSINITPATTSNTGAFSIHNLISGDFQLDAGTSWIVVSPKSFTVPLASPIKLVLKKKVTADIQGTVVDTFNAPVAGVDLAFDIYHRGVDGNRIGSQVDVRTGADGIYTLPAVLVDPNMLQRGNVTKKGYVFKGGGDIGALNGKVVVSQVVMAQLSGKINGTVYNGLGKRVADAWVSCPDSGSGGAPVQSDAAGHFELTNIAVGKVSIYAAKALFVSRRTVDVTPTLTEVTVRLPVAPTAPIGPANLSKATAILTQNINSRLLQNGQGDGDGMRAEAARVIAEVSPDAAVSFILSTSSISTVELGDIVSARIYSDPVGTAAWALFPTKRMSDNVGRGHVAATVGLAVAPYDTAAAAPYYNIATQYIHFDHLDQNSILDAATLTALAYVLHRPEADDDYAKVSGIYDELMKAPSNNQPGSSTVADWLPDNLTKIIALGNVDKAIAIINSEPVSNRYDNVPGIISELVKPDPGAAMKLYQWIAKQNDSPNSLSDQERSLCFVLPIIYKTDPKGAVAQANSLSNPDTQTRALTDLADVMPLAQAAPLYMEAEQKCEGQNFNGYSPACIASHAWQRDPVLGAKLFKMALTKTIVNLANSQQLYGERPSYSDFAFYYSHVDPAYCRLLLESQFAKNNRDTPQYIAGDGTEANVLGMCSIDINRALELAGEIKDPYVSYLATVKAAQYLLLTPKQRTAIPFAEWTANFQWVPGTPSN
jgi:hypothetical protein